MSKKIIFFLAFVFYFCYLPATGQVKKDIDNKAIQQQEMLLGKRQQEELLRQQQQKILLEKQKEQLAEKEKALLRLQYEKKEIELDNEKKQQSALLQKNQLQAQYEEAVRDKQITSQKAELAYNRRWLLFLGMLAILVIIISSIIYINQRKTKRLNKLIFIQNNELEKISMVKDRVLSVVGHDMRTPLNILLSFTQLLKGAHIGNNSCGGNGTDRLGSCDQAPCNTAMTSSIVSTSTGKLSKEGPDAVEDPSDALTVTVAPNPSTTDFGLIVKSKSQAAVTVRVLDVNGRVVDALYQVGIGSTIHVGGKLASGMYFAHVVQGNKQVVAKLVKVK